MNFGAAGAVKLSRLNDAPGRFGRGVEVPTDPVPPGFDIVAKILTSHFFKRGEDFHVAIGEGCQAHTPAGC